MSVAIAGAAPSSAHITRVRPSFTFHRTSIESRQRHIRPLPHELAQRTVRSVRCAGLANVMPAELSCKYPRTKMELCEAAQWTDGAVRHMEALLNDGVEITFEASVILEDDGDSQLDHHFGTVNVRTHAGHDRNAAYMLQELKWAMRLDDGEFNAAIGAAATCRLPRWKDNQGQQIVGRRNECNYGGARPISCASTSSTASGAAGAAAYRSGESGYLESDNGGMGGVSGCPPVAQKFADWIQRNSHVQAVPENGHDDGRQRQLKSLVVLKPTAMPRPPRHVPALTAATTAAAAPDPAPVIRTSALADRLQRVRVNSQSSIGVCEMPTADETSVAVPLPSVMMERIEMRKRLMRSLQAERERVEKIAEPMVPVATSVERAPLVVAKQPAVAQPKFVPAGFALSDLHTFNKSEDELLQMKPTKRAAGPSGFARTPTPQSASRMSLADPFW